MTTFYIWNDTAAGAGNGLLPKIYNRLEDSVYYVGQKLQVNADYTQGGAAANRGAIVNKVVQIVKAEHNRGGAAGAGSVAGINKAGTIAITFNEAISGGTLPLTESANFLRQSDPLAIEFLSPLRWHVVAFTAALILAPRAVFALCS